MQKRWVGKNVDLNQLSECIDDFFKAKGFATKKYELEKERTILWAPQRVKNVRKAMKTRILGEPNDFMIEFAGSEIAHRSIWLGLLTQFIGGGSLILRGSRLREALEKMESEFWIFIEERIVHLLGSAEHQ